MLVITDSDDGLAINMNRTNNKTTRKIFLFLEKPINVVYDFFHTLFYCKMESLVRYIQTMFHTRK